MHRHLIDFQAGKIGIHRTQHRILMHIARNNKLGSQKSIAEHREILTAIEQGDTEAADRLTSAHIEAALNNLLSVKDK